MTFRIVKHRSKSKLYLGQQQLWYRRRKDPRWFLNIKLWHRKKSVAGQRALSRSKKSVVLLKLGGTDALSSRKLKVRPFKGLSRNKRINNTFQRKRRPVLRSSSKTRKRKATPISGRMMVKRQNGLTRPKFSDCYRKRTKLEHYPQKQQSKGSKCPFKAFHL